MEITYIYVPSVLKKRDDMSQDLAFEESSILSAIIKGGKEFYIEALDVLTDKSFYSVDNRIVYQACSSLFESNQEINLVNVISKCNESGLDVDLQSITETDPASLGTIRPFSQKLKSRLILKESVNLHRAAIDKLSQMSATTSTDSIFSVSESTLFDLISKFSSNNDEIIKIGDKARPLVDYYGNNPSQNVGLPTPWPKFNASIGGGMRTGVTLIGARSGLGKTNIAIMCANFLAGANIPVLILDTEMEDKDIIPRMLANISEVEINKIETGSFKESDFEVKALEKAISEFEKFPIHYKSVSGKSFNEILSTIRRWVYTSVGLTESGKAKQCLIIYDYFKIMDSGDISDMQEYQAMGFQISKLTDFCKIYDVPCLSFVQLNRDGVAKEGTDVIAQSDRLLWLCNSFSIFKNKSPEEMEKYGWSSGNRKMITLKSRYGGEAQGQGDFISMDLKGAICSLKEVSCDTKGGNLGPN